MRTRRAVANYATGFLISLVTLVSGMIATPLLLRWLGEEEFGAFRAASDWFGYLTIFELGLGGALLALFARAAGGRDVDGIGATLAVGMRKYLRVVVITLLVGVGLAYALVWLVPVSPEKARDLQIGGLIGLLAVLWLPLVGPFRALIESRQQGYWINLLLMGQALVITGCALLFAFLGWGISGQFLAVTVGSTVLAIPLIRRGIRDYPGAVAAALRGERRESITSDIRKLSFPTLVLSICGRLSVQTDNIILALLLGPTMVVPVFLTQRLAFIAQGQLQGFGNASWAALAELHFQGERELFQRRLLDLTMLVGFSGAAVLTTVVVYNPDFIELWVGAERYGGDAVTLVAVANAYLLGIFSLWSWCFSGTGMVPRLMVPAVMQTVLNVAFSLLLTWRLGPVGPLLGTLVSLLAVSAWFFPKELRRIFGVPLLQLARSAGGPVALAIPFAFLLEYLSSHWPPEGWLALALHMGLAAAAFSLIGYYVLLRQTERTEILIRLRALLGRFRASR